MCVAQRSAYALALLLSAHSQGAHSSPSEPVSSSSAPAPSEGVIERGALTRRALEPYLKQGPQPIIASVRVVPERAKGRFIGFKLVMIAPGSPAERAGLKVGDVLSQVNSVKLEQPQQVMQVWAELPERSALTLTFWRATERLTYRWTLTP